MDSEKIITYKIDFEFFREPVGTLYYSDYDDETYSEICDCCGMRRKCICLHSDNYRTIMDICRKCAKAHGVREEMVE